MKTVTINGVSYPNTPAVQIPLTSGTGNATFYETSDANVDAGKLLNGYIAYGASGKITGTLTAPTVTQDSTTKVLTIR